LLIGALTLHATYNCFEISVYSHSKLRLTLRNRTCHHGRQSSIRIYDGRRILLQNCPMTLDLL